IFRQLAAQQRLLRHAAFWLSALLAVYALSLGQIAAVPSFGWGHVAMYALWSAIGLAVVVAGQRQDSPQLRAGGLIWLGVTLVVSFAHGEHSLGPAPRGATLLIVGAALIAAALADQLLARRHELTPIALALVLASVGLGLAACVALLGAS